MRRIRRCVRPIQVSGNSTCVNNVSISFLSTYCGSLLGTLGLLITPIGLSARNSFLMQNLKNDFKAEIFLLMLRDSSPDSFREASQLRITMDFISASVKPL